MNFLIKMSTIIERSLHEATKHVGHPWTRHIPVTARFVTSCSRHARPWATFSSMRLYIDIPNSIKFHLLLKMSAWFNHCYTASRCPIETQRHQGTVNMNIHGAKRHQSPRSNLRLYVSLAYTIHTYCTFGAVLDLSSPSGYLFILYWLGSEGCVANVSATLIMVILHVLR